MWPPAALEFLRDLEANNDSDWFRANRKRYDQDLLGPARELAESLSHLGEPHFFRPYNNLRFHPGPPLKEHLGVAIAYGPSGTYLILQDASNPREASISQRQGRKHKKVQDGGGRQSPKNDDRHRSFDLASRGATSDRQGQQT